MRVLPVWYHMVNKLCYIDKPWRIWDIHFDESDLKWFCTYYHYLSVTPFAGHLFLAFRHSKVLVMNFLFLLYVDYQDCLKRWLIGCHMLWKFWSIPMWPETPSIGWDYSSLKCDRVLILFYCILFLMRTIELIFEAFFYLWIRDRHNAMWFLLLLLLFCSTLFVLPSCP